MRLHWLGFQTCFPDFTLHESYLWLRNLQSIMSWPRVKFRVGMSPPITLERHILEWRIGLWTRKQQICFQFSFYTVSVNALLNFSSLDPLYLLNPGMTSQNGTQFGFVLDSVHNQKHVLCFELPARSLDLNIYPFCIHCVLHALQAEYELSLSKRALYSVLINVRNYPSYNIETILTSL